MLNTVKSFMMKNLNIGYLLIEVGNKPIAINVSIPILYSSKHFAYIYAHTTCDNALVIIARLIFAPSEIILYSRKWFILSNELKFPRLTN